MSRGSKNSSLNHCQSTFTHWLTLSLMSHLKCLTASPLLPTGRNWVWHCQSTFTHWLILILSLPCLISSVSLPVHFYPLADTDPESHLKCLTSSPLLPTGWHWVWVWHCQSTFTHWLKFHFRVITSNFKFQCQVPISIFNFRFQNPVSISSFNFKLQFMLQFQFSISSFQFQIQV